MDEKAYKICEDSSMLEAYLYACYRYMPADEYQKMIRQNQVLLEIDNILIEKIMNVKGKIKINHSENLLEEWKKEYRKA